MQIGAKIRQLRIANQMTQEELADRRSFRKALSARLKTTLLRRPLIRWLISSRSGYGFEDFFQ